MRFHRRYRLSHEAIHPDEIFLDSSNLPQFNRQQFEGRLEKPIAKNLLVALGSLFLLVGLS